MKIGRRLAIKLLNASKFALTLSQLSSDLDLTNITAASISEPVDQALIAKLAATVESATKAFEEFNYAKALDATETFFWEFTDDYVELVKERAYGETEGVNSERTGNLAGHPGHPAPPVCAVPAVHHRGNLVVV